MGDGVAGAGGDWGGKEECEVGAVGEVGERVGESKGGWRNEDRIS